MTVTTEKCEITYICDGTTNKFSIPFHFYNNDIAVYKNYSTETYQPDIDYKIKNYTPTTHYIEFKNTPPKDWAITITRKVKLVQKITFREGEEFPASAYELSLDNIVMALQELKEAQSRAFIASPGRPSPYQDFITRLQLVKVLNDYATTQDILDLNNRMISNAKLEIALSAYYTKTEINQLLGTIEQQLSEV